MVAWFFSLFLVFFCYNFFWKKLFFLTSKPFGWIDVMSKKVEPVLSGRWKIHLFCCRLWREEMAWWSILESNKQRWTDGKELLFMDGCQAGRLKFNVTPGAFFLVWPAKKAKGSSKTKFFLSFVYLINPAHKDCVKKQKTCFDLPTVSIICSRFCTESVQFWNSKVSRSTFAHLRNIFGIGSKPGGLLKIHCYQDARVIAWKAPSWSKMLQLWFWQEVGWNLHCSSAAFSSSDVQKTQNRS